MAELTLVLGGCRSGKSSWGRRFAEERYRDGIYLATAQALDEEMARRIRIHQAERGSFWKTAEVPFDLADFLSAPAPAGVVLIDCLTLWLSNGLLRDGEQATLTAMDRLVAALRDNSMPTVCIANEVGLSIVPDNALGRQFRDLAGFLNQKVAAVADRVVFMIAGIPQTLKPR